MVASFLALGSAIGLGTSDYLGGIRSRTHGLLVVLIISQAAALLLLLAGIAVLRPALPTSESITAALLAGAAEILGTAALYRGLAVGTTGIVAPAASAAPVVPLAIGIIAGLIPGPTQLLGIALVVAGVILASTDRSKTPSTTRPVVGTSLLWGGLAAVGFGSYLQLIGIASAGSVPWALFLARTAAVGILLISAVIVRLRRPHATHKTTQKVAARDVPGIAFIGVIILVADTLYATSSTLGDLALVAVLSSTHPVVTILWSRIHGHEQIGRLRGVGIFVTVLGVISITAT